MLKLTPNFDTDQLSRTDHTDLLEVNRAEAVKPPVLYRLTTLAQLLEAVLTDVFPGGFDVHDAYRSKALNAAVKGVPTSQHCAGEAADIMPHGYEKDLPLALMKLAVWGLKDPNVSRFGQLLIERGCIHISLPRQHDDGEVAWWTPTSKVVWRPGR